MINLQLTEGDAKTLKEILESNIDVEDLTSEELNVMGDIYDQIARKTCDDVLVLSDYEGDSEFNDDIDDSWIEPLDMESKG